MSAPVAIGEAVTGGALRATHFFNGRLLTGEDLGREQATQNARLARLGMALGDGVADGYAVSVAPGSSPANPVVTVTPGLAIARSGDALELRVQADVALAGAPGRPGAEPGALFADCQPYQESEYSTGVGVYLLSVGPKVIPEGLAPVSGLHNADAPCNTAYAVEGVSFRRLRLAIGLSELDDAAHLRNRVAYRMFDPDAVARLWSDPFGAPLDRYGLLDELRPDHLRDDEVPLALIGWKAGEGITFIDHWSVRRRVTRRGAGDRLAPLTGDRLLAEGEARFLQFQDQLDDLRVTGAAIETLDARTRFAQLPPVGFLPLADARWRGFGFREFLAAVQVRGPVTIEGDQVMGLVREAFECPPIDLTLAPAEALWLYIVRDNLRPPGGGTGDERPYVIFASGHTRYRGDARFALSYFNFANYAQIG
jgi:hypothetical protein